jgi:hypothetical protein
MKVFYLGALVTFTGSIIAFGKGSSDNHLNLDACKPAAKYFSQIEFVVGRVTKWNSAYDAVSTSVSDFRNKCRVYARGSDQQKKDSIQLVTRARDKLGTDLKTLRQLTDEISNSAKKNSPALLTLGDKVYCNSILKTAGQAADDQNSQLQQEGAAALTDECR